MASAAATPETSFVAIVDRILSERIAYVWRASNGERAGRTFVLALDRVRDEAGNPAEVKEGVAVAVRLAPGSEDEIASAIVQNGTAASARSVGRPGIFARLRNRLTGRGGAART